MRRCAKVLVIEDDDSIREYLVRMLSFEGYEVIAAANGADGVSVARTLRPDIIICDLLMPGVNGFGACRVLRDDPGTSGIPVVVLSALASPSDREVVAELGVAVYLTKPFRNQELIETVERCLRQGVS